MDRATYDTLFGYPPHPPRKFQLSERIDKKGLLNPKEMKVVTLGTLRNCSFLRLLTLLNLVFILNSYCAQFFCSLMNKRIKLTNRKVALIILGLLTLGVKAVGCLTLKDKTQKY